MVMMKNRKMIHICLIYQEEHANDTCTTTDTSSKESDRPPTPVQVKKSPIKKPLTTVEVPVVVPVVVSPPAIIKIVNQMNM